ncbi:hypothetical protein SAMN02746065_102179 [Desulfocicer vacuolatum DSM 3385]|uniref:Uncharacterized protein n=1 Tax=Desulfocicer vacuolatum DSM 3385 TaxID=1121400 RepID=A0A1W1ZBU9_9BACT|nr:hypothetical protein SAMN02746065_102179 [Desulfocicer vacuolatum DSM 3385]
MAVFVLICFDPQDIRSKYSVSTPSSPVLLCSPNNQYTTQPRAGEYGEQSKHLHKQAEYLLSESGFYLDFSSFIRVFPGEIGIMTSKMTIG